MNTPPIALVAVLVTLLSPALFAQRADVLIADFEAADYGAWKSTGEAFGPGPARGTLPNQMPVDGFQGRRLVNSFFKGDGSTGTLTSPPFPIERDYIQFLLGGGQHPGKTCINLLVEGKIVRAATGPNDKPGGSERLDWSQWDVRELVGRTAIIEIVDRATGGWGHINIDQIRQSDRRLPAMIADVSRTITVEKRYLNLPVKTGATKRRVSFVVDGQTAREFEIELADAEPEFWVFLDLAPFRGKSAVIRVDKLHEDSKALSVIEQADTLRGAENLYREPLRPQFHFTSRRGWNNDPNGLVFYQGEYHLYYQHNPYGWNWGNMHWAHAVSTNLIHWIELPIALYPRQFDDWAFSGSAVVDTQNTSGFQTGKEVPLVGAYTSTGRGECIVFSNDRGRTWSEFSGNPVVKHQGRDPRLLWHGPSKQWVMALYDESEGKQWITFYTSPNLKAWTYQSRVEGFFECPDLFELALDGDPTQKKWVLTAASSEYRVGQFDGRKFIAETPKLPGHRGNAFYAAQTYTGIPSGDGRCIQIGWLQAASPGMPFNQGMSVPLSLALHATPEGPRLAWTPVKEIDGLRGPAQTVRDRTLSPGNPVFFNPGDLLDLQVEFDPGAADEVGLRIRGTAVTFDTKKQELVCGNRRTPLRPENGRLRLRLLVDRTSLEIFAAGGLVYLPMSFRAITDKPIEVYANGGEAQLIQYTAYELRSIWR